MSIAPTGVADVAHAIARPGLTARRNRAKLSLSRLAGRADVSIRTLVRAEAGERIWTRSAIRIAEALEVDVDEIFEAAA